MRDAPRLHDLLTFAEVDLQANRAGHVSDDQRQTLLKMRRARLLNQPALLALIGSGVWLLLFRGGGAFVGLALLLGAFALWLNGLAQAITITIDLRDPQVQAIQGRITLIRSINGFFVRIGDETLRVNLALYQYFSQNRGIYTLYYTPNAKVLLAVE